jgi:hypothetical protein
MISELTNQQADVRFLKGRKTPLKNINAIIPYLRKKTMDNNAKSCFRIDPMKSEFAYWHDFRQGFQASNVQGAMTKDNEYSCSFSEARALAKKMKDEADAAYRARTGRRPSYNSESIYWEATVNLRGFHTREDVEKVVQILEKRLGYRTVFWTRHRDEGHLATDDEMDELGLSSTDQRPFILNDHVHIGMFSLDEDGNSLHRRNFGKPGLISQIQTEIAQALGMERGISKKITKRTHLTPRQYRQAMSLQEPLQVKLGDVKNELKDAKKQIKELERQLKEANKQARADLQEQGGKREDYSVLEAENKRLKDELAELKKAPDISNIEDFKKSFEDKIRELMKHSKIKEIAEQTLNNEAILKPVTFGGYSKESVSAYVLGSVARYNAANKTLEKAQTFIHELAVKKEISTKAQLAALRENKTLGGFLGATASKMDVDVAVLKREKMGLVDTVDQLQKQNKALQKTLKATTDLVKQKDIEIETLKKSNQEGLAKTDNNFYLGQASMLSELVSSGKLYIEPKGRYLVESLDGYLKGEYPSADSFAGIKSGLLSYAPALHSPKNDLDFK